MMETKPGNSLWADLLQIRANRFEERVGSDDVRIDEIGRAVDRPVNVALRCQMHDGVG